MIKYVFETEEPIKNCQKCPFGHMDDNASWIDCEHPNVSKDAPATMREEEGIIKPDWCPLKRALIKHLQATTRVSSVELASLPLKEIEPYMHARVVKDIAAELVEGPYLIQLTTEDPRLDAIKYQTSLNVYEEVPDAKNNI